MYSQIDSSQRLLQIFLTSQLKGDTSTCATLLVTTVPSQSHKQVIVSEV